MFRLSFTCCLICGSVVLLFYDLTNAHDLREAMKRRDKTICKYLWTFQPTHCFPYWIF